MQKQKIVAIGIGLMALLAIGVNFALRPKPNSDRTALEAQMNMRGGPPGGRPGPGGMGPGGRGPEGMGPRGGGMMGENGPLSQLDLTEDQTVKLKAVETKMRANFQSGQPPDMAVMEKTRQEIESVLTPEQRQKLRSIMPQGGPPGMGGGPPGMGGLPPR